MPAARRWSRGWACWPALWRRPRCPPNRRRSVRRDGEGYPPRRASVHGRRSGEVAKTEDFECIGLLIDYHHSVRGFAPRLLNAFEFRAAPPAADIVRGLDCLREMYAVGKRD